MYLVEKPPLVEEAVAAEQAHFHSYTRVDHTDWKGCRYYQ